MKKENDDITGLFRSRLEKAELTPRDTLWDDIHKDIPHTAIRRRPLFLRRFAAAACALLVLGAATAAFLLLTSKETGKMQNMANGKLPNAIVNDINHSKTATENGKTNTGNVTATTDNGTSATDNSLTTLTAHQATVMASKTSRSLALRHATSTKKANNTQATDDDDSTFTVTMHMTVRIRNNGDYADNNGGNNGVWKAGGLGENKQETSGNSSNMMNEIAKVSNQTWALKTAFNLSMPASGKYESPTGGSITIEKRLNNWLALESGVEYTYMHSNEGTQHYLGVPLKANLQLAKSEKAELYATAGGAADKCVSSTVGGNGEAIQFTALAGLGLRYRVSKNLSLYAEPTYMHYFDNSSKYLSYRNERKNAFNFKCGLSMSY
jgi:hypothetical protein